MKEILKKIYETIPFKKEIYSLVRPFVKLPKKLHQYFYFTGVFSVKVEDKTFKIKNYGYQFHVENELFWGGIENGWEKVSTGLWIKLCKSANTIFDIGANTGFYSLLAKTLRPKSKVFAFEPLEGILKKLKYNVEINNYDVNISDNALSNFTGTAKVYPTSLDHVYSITVNKNMFTGEKVFEQTIKTIRLDEFIEKNNVGKIDLMKIDVETHEVEVLEGMGKYLAIMKPAMLIEIQTDEIAKGVEKLIQGLGYLYFNIDEKKGITRLENLGKSDTLNCLLCDKESAIRLGLIK